MEAGELGYKHVGKRVTVSGTPDWTVRGALVAVTHEGPNLRPEDEHRMQTVLTLALNYPDSQLSTVIVSPSDEATVD